MVENLLVDGNRCLMRGIYCPGETLFRAGEMPNYFASMTFDSMFPL